VFDRHGRRVDITSRAAGFTSTDTLRLLFPHGASRDPGVGFLRNIMGLEEALVPQLKQEARNAIDKFLKMYGFAKQSCFAILRCPVF